MGKGVEEYLSLMGRGFTNGRVFDTNRYMGEEEYLSLMGRGTTNVLVFDANRSGRRSTSASRAEEPTTS